MRHLQLWVRATQPTPQLPESGVAVISSRWFRCMTQRSHRFPPTSSPPAVTTHGAISLVSSTWSLMPIRSILVSFTIPNIRLSTWEALPSLAPSVFSSKVCGSNVKFVVLFTVMHALQGRTATSYSPEDRSILVQLLLLPAWTVPQDPLHLKPRTVAPIRYLTF